MIYDPIDPYSRDDPLPTSPVWFEPGPTLAEQQEAAQLLIAELIDACYGT